MLWPNMTFSPVDLGARTPYFGDSIPVDTKGSPFARNSNFERRSRAQQMQLLCQNFQKVPKTPFLACFFNALPEAQKVYPKQKSFEC